MPYYSYQCQDCGEVFDIRATIREKEAGLEPECPRCHRKRTRQSLVLASVLRSKGGTMTPPSGCCSGPGSGCCGG